MLFKKKGWGKFLAIALFFTFLFQCVSFIVPETASAATTELTITKYAEDGKTIIDQVTVHYHWLMDSDNIPVLGDGTTRYYHQGPVFIDEPADDPVELERLRWNEEEDRNWDTKDMGAVKGNNLKDLCNLVGGMVESDEVQIKATDGFNKKFAYKNVYNYDPDREGPMVVCWYKDGLYPDTGYTDGMRLVWFAAASSKVGPTDVAGLPSGDYHVFGNWEWREAADPEYWYYYSGIYPTTTGLSVQNVASINIYSNETVLTPPDLTADTEDNQIGQAVDITFTDDEDWRTAISRIRVNGREIDGENYSLSPGKISIVADVFDQAGEYNIAVIAEGYSMVTVTQSMVAAPSAPVAAFSADKTSGPAPLTVQFTDESTGNPTSWEWDFDNDGEVDSTQQNPSHEYTQVGTYTVKLTVTNSAGNDDEIKTNYITVSEPGVPVTGVSITEGDQTLEIGQTVQLTAVVEPENATDKNVFWSSDNDAVAMVDGAGLVTAIAEGAAIITVTTEDGNKTDSITVTVVEGSGGPTVDVLYEGTVILTPGETFTVTVGTNEYTINDNTPLGALQAAAEAGKFSYLLSDKRWSYDGVLLLDDVGQYVRKSPGYWYAYVNDVYKDGYQNTPDGLNVIEMLDGDKVEFYYAAGISDPNDLNAVKAAATAAVKTVVALSTIDVIYDGTLNLDPEEEFIVSAYNSGTEYTVNQNTPLGALHKAAIASGFTYDVTDKNYGNSGALLLDRIADYNYVKNGSAWYAYVNGALKDGYNNPDGALNLIQLADGDKVEFYYADVEDETDFNAVKAAATAAVKITVANGVVPTDWTLQLSGARDETIPKAYFEQGLACPSSGHQVSWTEDKGTPDTSDDDVWSGVPLWLLVAMVDDNPDLGDEHINFNDELAAAGYEVKVIAGDGWSTVLDSADIARSDAYIIANTLNGEALPLKTESGKDCWPLQLKGSAISGGQQVGNIVRIELSGLPEPPAGWTLEMLGEIGDTITQAEFEEGLACTGSGHCQEWTDQEGKVWSGVPLWVLLGVVDDIENGGHWTFKENLANSYTVKVVAGDGFSKTFNGADVAKSNDYIVANIYDGKPISDGSAPLRLVGDGVTKEDGSLGGLAVGNIARIEIPELQTPPAADGSWNLTLDGIISDVISQAEFEEGLACPYSGHLVEWTDADGNVWSGIPLWYLAGWVDDRQPHSYDFNQAVAGYKVIVKAADGYSVDFDSQAINKSSDYIIANKCNGVALTDSWPLRLVGDGVANAGALTGKSVGQVVEIKLTSFTSGDSGDIPELRIVKYGEDGTTIIAEETLTYLDMIEQFDVIGDGETLYKYQGVTFDPEDIWDENETGKGGFKIANAIKGTRVSDLCSLVDGMGTGTDIVFVASDGWETKLPYSSIYPDPSVYARQGDAILAWFADGKYVPDYRDGMRLFFTPEDKVYSQMDMHETLPEAYWHYYYDEVMYPSCAGLSAKYVTEIRVYSVPQGDWTLELDGTEIGGIESDISKTYFESALTCTFGANHKASYTDSKNRVWEGMPLWFLVGFVDDADQHSDNAFNAELAQSGAYKVVLTADDGHAVTIDGTEIARNNNYIVANTLDGLLIPETDDNWPLRLVGPNLSGKQQIGQIVSIKLVAKDEGAGKYNLTPAADAAYTIGTTTEGISTMTVNAGVSGFNYFTVNIEPVVSHSGNETVVFTHMRNGSQLQINSTRADFDQVGTAQAGFNVQAGDVIKVYIVDELTNAADHNPVILQ